MPAAFLPRTVLALAASAAVALGAGCGDDGASGSSGPDPAAALPATAPLYVEAQVSPGGDLADNVKAVSRKLLGTEDVGQKVVGLIDDQLGERGASYEKDIAPWLGQRAGVALTALGGRDADGVAAIVSKDDDKAKAYIDARPQTEQREYRGVAYRVKAADDEAAAIIDHTVLFGTEAGVKSAIDATKGNALADAKAFKEARDAIGTDGLGFFYMDPGRTFAAALGAASRAGASQAQMLQGALTGTGLRSIAGRLDVASDALRADVAVLGAKRQTPAGGDAAAAAAAVPADAWLSVGVGDVGAYVQNALKGLGRSGASSGIDPAVLLQQLKAGFGVDVQQDFLSWMGDAAFFVRGTKPDTVGGGLIVHSKDPAASRRAIGTIDGLLTTFDVAHGPLRGVAGAEGLEVHLSGVDRPIDIAAKDDRFVVAFGEDALRAALGGGAQLGQSPAFTQAAGLLGGPKPSLFLNTPSAVALLGAFAGSAPGFRNATPTLDALGPLVAGGEDRDGVTHAEVAIAVR